MLASATAEAGGRVVFHDDFNGTAINVAAWSVGTWTLGRTQLGNGPVVSGGIAQLRFDTLRFTGAGIYTKADELDIEVLSKQVHLSSGDAPLLPTTWHDWDETHPSYNDGVHHSSQSAFIAGLDVNAFRTCTIRWLPGRTEWLVDGVLVASSTLAQPDLATPLRLNFWAPASSWTDACDAQLTPVGSKRQNKSYDYDIDWVEVRRL